MSRFIPLEEQKKLFWAYAPGMLSISLSLSLLVWGTTLGIPPLTAYPYVNTVINFLLWDPMLLVVNLHALIVPSIAITTAVLKRDWAGLKQYATSLFCTLGFTEIAKLLFARTRPNGFNDASFFSGHTSSAFSGAGYVHHRYGLTRALPLYLLASSIGCARVAKHWHYPSDVIAGAGAALLISYNMITQQNKTDNAPETAREATEPTRIPSPRPR